MQRRDYLTIHYLRFVTLQRHEDSRQPEGVFVAAHRLLEEGEATRAERQEIEELLAWFNQHLPVPETPRVGTRAIFWFRVDAQECIRRMWDLTRLLRGHGCLVEVQKAYHLHNRVYEDEFHVAVFASDHDVLGITN